METINVLGIAITAIGVIFLLLGGCLLNFIYWFYKIDNEWSSKERKKFKVRFNLYYISMIILPLGLGIYIWNAPWWLFVVPITTILVFESIIAFILQSFFRIFLVNYVKQRKRIEIREKDGTPWFYPGALISAILLIKAIVVDWFNIFNILSNIWEFIINILSNIWEFIINILSNIWEFIINYWFVWVGIVVFIVLCIIIKKIIKYIKQKRAQKKSDQQLTEAVKLFRSGIYNSFINGYSFSAESWLLYFQNVDFKCLVEVSTMKQQSAWNNDLLSGFFSNLNKVIKKNFDDDFLEKAVDFWERFQKEVVEKVNYEPLNQWFNDLKINSLFEIMKKNKENKKDQDYPDK